jgi:hypothetical protein
MFAFKTFLNPKKQMHFKIYTVWHQRIFPELLADVPEDDKSSIVMFGVNESIPKEVNEDDCKRFNVVFEYQLPRYEMVWQAQGYCQTSCMIHVLLNPELHMGLDYIGFAQYDMKYSASTIQNIRDVVAANPGRQIIFHELTLPVVQALGYSTGWDQVLEHYNSFFGTRWTFPDIVKHPRCPELPVVHTFVIPTLMFIKMMEWMYAYLRSVRAGVYPTNISQAEFAERIHGLFLVLECISNPDTIMQPFLIEHKWPYYHDQVPFDGYKCITAANE